jgi:DNA-binding MarR family transcriptional regulator
MQSLRMQRPPAGRADEELADAVLTASRALVGVAARSLAAVEEEVSLSQYRLLVVLASRGPQRIATLAEALGVNPSSATRLCDRLARRGLVRRRRTTADRREVRVSLAPLGRALVQEVTARRRDEIGRLLADVPAAQRDRIVEALEALARAAGEPPEREWAFR